MSAIQASQLAGDLARAAVEDGLDNCYNAAVQMTMAVGLLNPVRAGMETVAERLSVAARTVAVG